MANLVQDQAYELYMEQGLHQSLHLLVQCYSESFSAETWRLVIWIMSVLSEYTKDSEVFYKFVMVNSNKLLEMIG